MLTFSVQSPATYISGMERNSATEYTEPNSATEWIRDLLIDHIEDSLDEHEMDVIMQKGHVSPVSTPRCAEEHVVESELVGCECSVPDLKCTECNLPMWQSEIESIDIDNARRCPCCKHQCSVKFHLFNWIGGVDVFCTSTEAKRKAYNHFKSDLLLSIKEIEAKLKQLN